MHLDNSRQTATIVDREYVTWKSLRAEEKEWYSDIDLYSEFSVTLPEWQMAASVSKVSYWTWQSQFPIGTPDSQKLGAS